MDIIIPIKQVPETSNVKMDEKTGTMVRNGAESIINPLDLYAIETGLILKEKYDGMVTVITMGPPTAEKALREAIAMGCDNGILLSGKEFAGSDTWATSYALSSAIKNYSNYSLILTGERATDGDTGQVGPGIASFLDIPLATYTSKILNISSEYIIVERLIEEGYEQLKMPMPALLTVVKEISYPRLPTLRGKQRAKEINLLRFSADELDIDIGKIGIKGSPTRVARIDHPKVTRNGEVFHIKRQEDMEYTIEKLLDYLQKKDII